MSGSEGYLALHALPAQQQLPGETPLGDLEQQPRQPMAWQLPTESPGGFPSAGLRPSLLFCGLVFVNSHTTVPVRPIGRARRPGDLSPGIPRVGQCIAKSL